ncbi:host attachment family protein [Alterisphingorhabdus coralli]|uniref:Host attachment family protein n=1 Tax=Alterisphingorhabdus coralli TaxID=3071408 RepID=A0AA97F4F0_9SPHN|nr:host attachment family protein [Parasphingorhabdus sp. SCSIO 66989]WOE74129.1 host attachment family protein [Parasphingorhabdus sp. SCSIO 66989]
MPSSTIPANCLVVVATGAEAKLYRNVGEDNALKLRAEGTLTPKDLLSEGPSGGHVPSSSPKETDEATFSKQLAHHLYAMEQKGDYNHLVLAADPDSLGEIRPLLHKEVTDKIVLEMAKTLTNSSIKDIERSIQSN